ncbi:MAG: chemotaxis protein CheW [Nitrospirae bacterium YQR-1]
MTDAIMIIPYIAFRCGRFVYAVDSLHVREIIHLPEFKLIDEAPDYVAGLVNVRGGVIPLIDIDKRFGRKGLHYSLTDKVIIFSHNKRLIGVIVNEIEDIYDIPSDSIEKAPLYSDDTMHRSGFIEQVAKINEDILMILSHHKLFDSRIMALITQYEGLESTADELLSDKASSSEENTETAAVFHKRAVALALRDVLRYDGSALMPVAVVELENELFGIELESIREFISVQEYRQVPCCPSHIIGNINLRGEIVTLIDIRSTIGLSRSGSGKAMDSAVVVVIDNFTVGICIETLRDVLYLPASEQKELPIAVRDANENFFKCTAIFEDRAIVVLNLQSVLYRGGLVVNDSL